VKIQIAITTIAIAKITGQILFDGCFPLTVLILQAAAKATSCSMV
jgi:hypothetical protein